MEQASTDLVIHQLGYAVTLVDKDQNFRTEGFSASTAGEAIAFAAQVYPELRAVKAVPFTYSN